MMLAMLLVLCIYVILISVGTINKRSDDLVHRRVKPKWHDKIDIHYLINKLK